LIVVMMMMIIWWLRLPSPATYQHNEISDTSHWWPRLINSAQSAALPRLISLCAGPGDCLLVITRPSCEIQRLLRRLGRNTDRYMLAHTHRGNILTTD
jgi:hypothetical protein